MRGLRLDDPSQPPPRRKGVGWARYELGTADAWITAYRARSLDLLGTYADFRGEAGARLYAAIEAERPDVDAILSTLGRSVTLQHLHARLGRTITATAEEIRVSNPAGFDPDPPFAEVPRASADLNLMALLHGAVVIPSITLDRPAVVPR